MLASQPQVVSQVISRYEAAFTAISGVASMPEQGVLALHCCSSSTTYTLIALLLCDHVDCCVSCASGHCWRTHSTNLLCIQHQYVSLLKISNERSNAISLREVNDMYISSSHQFITSVIRLSRALQSYNLEFYLQGLLTPHKAHSTPST